MYASQFIYVDRYVDLSFTFCGNFMMFYIYKHTKLELVFFHANPKFMRTVACTYPESPDYPLFNRSMNTSNILKSIHPIKYQVDAIFLIIHG